MASKSGVEFPLRTAFEECRPLLWGAFAFGLFIALLMVAVPIYSLQVLDRVLSSGSYDTLIMLTIVVAGAIVFMGLLQGLRSLIFSQIGRWLDDRLSSDLVTKTVKLSVYKRDLGTQPVRDLGTVRGFVTSPHLANLFDAPWAVIFFAVIYFIHPWLGAAVTVGALILLVLAIIAERVPSRSARAANDNQVKAMQALDQLVRNAEVIQSMGLMDRASRKWRAFNQDSLEKGFTVANISTVIAQSTRSLRLAIQVLVTALGAYFVLQSELTAGGMIAVSILTGRALAPFDAAVGIYQGFVNARRAAARLLEMEEAAPLAPRTMELPEPKGALTVFKATYEEPVSKRWLLRGVNIEIEPGEALGIIGPSGSGKTTLARLLVGVLEPSTGAIRLDGAALQQWDPDQRGAAIGYLPQSVELFDGTIAENIARLDPEADDKAVVKAAQTAMVHEAILGFPQGYHTEIGPGGSLLSAGQRQRIALARCFYGEPKLVVMDEPNSNLDTDGEIAFVQALARAKERGITTVTVAHRPSVLQSVDKLLVLQGGEAKMFGPAQEIMQTLAENARNVAPIRKTGETKL
ncbi:MAG: type I secretion system permease/ATPase [Pseudomonadota bacterium]